MSAALEGMTLELSDVFENAPETSMRWTLETFTDGPEGSFVFLDDNDHPRLIVTADELLELKRRANAEVLGSAPGENNAR